jgi:hypothetical protein
VIDAVDWEGLSRSLGTLSEVDGVRRERGSGEVARQAIEVIFGEEMLRDAVDYYVSLRPGFELARGVLWQLRPWSAMKRCYEIFASGAPLDDRRSAVELLRVVADRRAVIWIPELLADDDAGIQVWGAGVLDQLLLSGLIEPGEAEDLLQAAERHANPSVRETAKSVREFLAYRDTPNE